MFPPSLSSGMHNTRTIIFVTIYSPNKSLGVELWIYFYFTARDKLHEQAVAKSMYLSFSRKHSNLYIFFNF